MLSFTLVSNDTHMLCLFYHGIKMALTQILSRVYTNLSTCETYRVPISSQYYDFDSYHMGSLIPLFMLCIDIVHSHTHTHTHVQHWVLYLNKILFDNLIPSL